MPSVTSRRLLHYCCLTAMTLFVVALSGSARADTELRWKFKAGDVDHYEMKMDMIQDTKAGDMPFQVKMNQIMDMTWEIKEVSDDGAATMNQTVDRVRMELTLPQAGQAPIKYDSQQKENPPGTEVLAKTFSAMVGKPFVVKVTPVGKVLDLSAPAELVGALKGAGGPAGGLMSEEGLKQMIAQTMMPLPEAAVPAGATWDKLTEINTPPFGKQVSKTVYKYAGPAESDGRTLEKIDVDMDIKFDVPADSPTKIKLKESKSGGDILWDNAGGRPAESTINSKMTFEITVGGMSIEQAVTTKVQTKLVSPAAKRDL